MSDATTAGKPCAGLTGVEVAVGTSVLGLGLAGGVPGMILADLGADVVRVTGPDALPIDADLAWSRPWHRDKRVVITDEAEDVRVLLAEADEAGAEQLVAILAGDLIPRHDPIIERLTIHLFYSPPT